MALMPIRPAWLLLPELHAGRTQLDTTSDWLAGWLAAPTRRFHFTRSLAHKVRGPHSILSRRNK